VHGVTDEPLPGVASLGLRPTVDDSGRVLLEVTCSTGTATRMANSCASNS
jgi:hypothetical protein